MTKKQITADEATALKAVTARSRGAEGELDELRRRLRKMKVMEGVCSRHSIKKKEDWHLGFWINQEQRACKNARNTNRFPSLTFSHGY